MTQFNTEQKLNKKAHKAQTKKTLSNPLYLLLPLKQERRRISWLKSDRRRFESGDPLETYLKQDPAVRNAASQDIRFYSFTDRGEPKQICRTVIHCLIRVPYSDYLSETEANDSRTGRDTVRAKSQPYSAKVATISQSQSPKHGSPHNCKHTSFTVSH